MFVGRNKRTKGFGTLLQTAKILKEWGRDEFVWYLHTHVHDTMTNSSMPLDQMTYIAGVDDRVIFPDLQHQVYGVPYDEPIKISVQDTDDLALIRRIGLNTYSMIERYNLADIFVNASELEGHGLTYLEAMGCGVPVISVDDLGVQREVIGSGGIFVPAKHFDTSWHTGAWLAQADPKDLAKAIIDLTDNQQLYDEMVEAALQRYQEFTATGP